MIVIRILNGSSFILCFGIYPPCNDGSSEYLNKLSEVNGYIQSVVEAYPGGRYMLFGDFNFPIMQITRVISNLLKRVACFIFAAAIILILVM